MDMRFAENVYGAISQTKSDGEWRPGHNHHWLVGNGGSRAICSHIATDMLKQGLSAFVVGDDASLTMAANDHGYGEVFSRHIRVHARPGDTLIAISSSGNSISIANAIEEARGHRCGIVTFTGFSPDNPIRKMGDINYWIPSTNYGTVELATLTILHAIVNPGTTT